MLHEEEIHYYTTLLLSSIVLIFVSLLSVGVSSYSLYRFGKKKPSQSYLPERAKWLLAWAQLAFIYMLATAACVFSVLLSVQLCDLIALPLSWVLLETLLGLFATFVYFEVMEGIVLKIKCLVMLWGPGGDIEEGQGVSDQSAEKSKEKAGLEFTFFRQLLLSFFMLGSLLGKLLLLYG